MEKKSNRSGTLLFLPLRLLQLVLDGAKEAVQRSGGGNCPFQHLEFPKGSNIGDRILQTETVGGALRAQEFYFCSSEVGN